MTLRTNGDSDMTIYLTALSNDRARLICKEAQFWGEGSVEDANLIEARWKKQGFITVRRAEG